MSEPVHEVWFDDSYALAFDGRVVELFGGSSGSERYHRTQFGYQVKGVDKHGNRRMHLGFAHKPGKLSAGVLVTVEAVRWPELESLLRAIDEAVGPD